MKLVWRFGLAWFLLLAACGGASDGGSAGGAGQGGGAQATFTKSGLDQGRALSALTEQERTQFCMATVKTLFSASTPEHECDLEGIEAEVLLGAQMVSCEQARSDCLQGFNDTHMVRCTHDLREHPSCTATVGDGETCTFETAKVRAMILPAGDCDSSDEQKQAVIPQLSAVHYVADLPECHRYVTCRMLL